MTTMDMVEVWGINQENVPAVGEETLEALTEILAMSSISLVAEASGRIFGFCMVLPPTANYGSPNFKFFCERFEDFVYLDRVAVTASAQGQGIGAELYRAVENESGAKWFALEVNTKPRNEGSLRFHIREGFIEVEERETRPGKRVSLMIKKLQE